MGWRISASCIKPIHQPILLQAGKERHRVLLTLSKIRRGRDFPPASSSPAAGMVLSGKRGEEEAALSSGGFPGLDRAPGMEFAHAPGTLDTLRDHWTVGSC